MVDRNYIKEYMENCGDDSSDFAFFILVLLDELDNMDKRIEDLENGKNVQSPIQ